MDTEATPQGTPRRVVRRPIFFLLFFSLIVAAIAFLFSQIQIGIDSNVCENNIKPIVLTLVGDLLIGDGKVWQEIVKDDYGPAVLGGYFDLIRRSDLVFANFEGIISQGGEPRAKNLPPQFSLRTDPGITNFLEHFGNIVISFANNHSADFGYDAINDTIRLLDETDIGYTGIGRSRQEALTPRVREVRGIRVAFIALTDLLPSQYYATDSHAGIAELTPENLKNAIESARRSSDFVVVSFHTAKNIAEPFSPIPDSHQQLYSRMAIDYGADIVVGQHPHGLQSVERYHGKLIFYSLGLFLYDPSVSQRYSPTNPLFQSTQFKGGGILTLEICREGLRRYNLVPTKIKNKNGNLIVVPEH